MFFFSPKVSFMLWAYLMRSSSKERNNILTHMEAFHCFPCCFFGSTLYSRSNCGKSVLLFLNINQVELHSSCLLLLTRASENCCVPSQSWKRKSRTISIFSWLNAMPTFSPAVYGIVCQIILMRGMISFTGK